MPKLDIRFGADDERSNTVRGWEQAHPALLINPQASAPVLVGAALARLQRCRGIAQAADVAIREDGTLDVDGTNAISAMDSLLQEAGALLDAIDWGTAALGDGAAQ